MITRPRRLIDIESVDTASRVLTRRGRFDTDPDNQCSFPSSIDSNYYGKLVLPPGPLHVHVLMARNFNSHSALYTWSLLGCWIES